jgi:hypothetical protein
MKLLALSFYLSNLLSPQALAHEGGHAPTVNDSGRYGGIVAGVMEHNHDHNHHDHDDHHSHSHHHTKDDPEVHEAPGVRYKAELVRSADQVLRLYLFNTDMSPVSPSLLSPTADAELTSMAGKKKSKQTFTLKLAGRNYQGNLPNQTNKPFDAEFVLKIAGKEMVVAFDHLD